MTFSLQPDPKINCAGAPVITLAGVEWFVPQLALRQLRNVAPALMSLLPALSALQKNSSDARLETVHVDALAEAVHAALSRAYPQLTKDAFLDLETTLAELVAAIPVIARQTGLFHPVSSDDDAGKPAGETRSPTSIS